jgi:DNA topoisomerase-1
VPRTSSPSDLPRSVAESVGHAASAGLRHVNDDAPGITRRRAGKGFAFLSPSGARVRDAATIERIRKLAVPPAWTQVWICPSADGHVQATGRDARGRKQYRYHARWREVRDDTKHERLAHFARKLPALRERVERDLRRKGLPREKVLALVVRVLDLTAIRVGNAEYARDNDSFGLTTLRDRHAKVRGRTIELGFRGKSGRDQVVRLDDARLARLVRRCRDLPGQELFQYLDGERVVDVGSGDVNAYLKQVTGEELSAKYFRTWTGTVHVTALLREAPTVTKKRIVEAIAGAAERLGNRPATCRKYYVHPAVPRAYLAGRLENLVTRGTRRSRVKGLSADERAALAVIESQVRDPGASLERDLERSVARSSARSRARSRARSPARPRASRRGGASRRRARAKSSR